jgi:hypothetical protein
MVQAVIQTTVTGLQGNPVATGTPAANQSLTWNGTAWAPAGPFFSAAGGTLTGPLVLAGNATTALNPVPLQQLQAGYLPLVGGTINGNLSVTGGLSGSSNLGISGNATVNGAIYAGNAGFFTNALHITANGVVYGTQGSANAMAYAWNGGTGINVWADNSSLGVLIMQTSDATLKTNLAAMTVDPLSVLDKITLQQFDWLPQTVGTVVVQKPHASCGFTAQQVETLIPEAVISSTGEPLSVDLMPLVSYCIGGIQRLVTMIQQLQTAVGALQTNANTTATAWDTV